MTPSSLLDQYLIPCGVQFDVIGLCETRLIDNLCKLYNQQLFSIFFNNSTQGGGLAIYVHNNIKVLESAMLACGHPT